ncbi:hypothetical protein ACFE04_002923 [Oxalis oulophora]
MDFQRLRTEVVKGGCFLWRVVMQMLMPRENGNHGKEMVSSLQDGVDVANAFAKMRGRSIYREKLLAPVKLMTSLMLLQKGKIDLFILYSEGRSMFYILTTTLLNIHAAMEAFVIATSRQLSVYQISKAQVGVAAHGKGQHHVLHRVRQG